jgi:AraC-like DNA-binding protein
VSHRGTADYEPDLAFYWIHFEAQTKGRSRGHGELLPQYATPKRPERLTELFHRYLDDQESGRLTREQSRLLVGLMLLEIQHPEARTSPSEENLAGRAERHIATHFTRGLHAGDVANAIGCHADYLGRVYRKVYGHTLSEAIHQKQIAEARRLLRESDQNLDAVAAASGFQGSRYFRKLFHEYQGLSPRAYRSLYSRAHINVR